jgi:hypothetical protein
MSEHAPKSHESDHTNHEQIEIRHPRSESEPRSREQDIHSPEKAAESLEALRHEVAEKAVSKENVVVDHEKGHKQTPQPMINKELKSVMLTRTLARIQKQLSPSQRTFSKVVHSKPVDRISTVGEKTVARPYGILGGSLLALLGSVFSTFLSKQFGLNYNLLLFVVLFVIGYILATCTEGLIRVLHKAKK